MLRRNVYRSHANGIGGVSRGLTIAALAILLVTASLSACRPDSSDAVKANIPNIPQPQFSRPVFNNPLGTSAQQRAIFDQLIGLIQNTPSGEQITLVMHQFDTQSAVERQVADSLINADKRGVKVKVLLDSRNGKPGVDGAYKALVRGLNGDSGVRLCGNVPGAERGCIARVRNHNKFATFSRVVVGGESHSDVVFQSSANLTDWYLNQSYNDSYTVDGDQRLYNSYMRYAQDLFEGSSLVANRDTGLHWKKSEYFWSASGSSPGYHAYFYPRVRAGNVIADELKRVACQYKEGGTSHISIIRIVMLSFTSARWDVARELAHLAKSRCSVGMVFDSGTNPNNHNAPSVDKQIRKFLMHAGVDMVPCNFYNPGPLKKGNKLLVVPHAKDVAIDGSIGGRHVKEIYTGSANLADAASSDDVTLKIVGSHPHDDYYVRWMNNVDDACMYRGKKPSIP